MSKKPKTPRVRQRLPEIQRKQLGRRIRHLRLDQDLQQVELARRTEIDPASMNQIELGKRAPDLATMFRLAEVLNVPVGRLLEDAPPPARTSHGPDMLVLAEGLAAALQQWIRSQRG